MKGDPQVISYLNQHLAVELTGFKQYLLHSQVCEDQGLHRLKEIQHHYSVDETNNAAKLLQRIFFLEGQPVMEAARKVAFSVTVVEQLERDLDLVGHAISLLRISIPECESRRDYVSRELLQELLDDEEKHFHWLETELGLIERMGLQNYLQSQA